MSGNNPKITKDTCGKWLYVGCLNSKKHGLPVANNQVKLHGGKAHGQNVIEGTRMSCGRLGCPVCYEKASAKQAIKIEHRLKQFKWKNRKETKYYHWTVSPPESDISTLTYKQLKKKAIDVARQSGIAGGCVIFHHLRRYNENDLKQDIKAGADWKTAPASWYFSPQFHIIGVAFTSAKQVTEMHKKTGWICKNLGERKSVRETSLYQLSHAFIPQNKGHAVSWFGVCSYNKLIASPCPSPPPRVCPKCGEPMKKVRPVNEKTEQIVITTIQKEGIYFFDHGVFELIPEKAGVWLGSG